MPRQSRKNLTGEFFHLIVQGINKERIFESDKMKEAYKRYEDKYFGILCNE